jgi:hypothetical protein
VFRARYPAIASNPILGAVPAQAGCGSKARHTSPLLSGAPPARWTTISANKKIEGQLSFGVSGVDLKLGSFVF